MSRTTRTVLTTGLAAAASFGVMLTPAHAATATVSESVSATWTFVGATPGAPGNVHTGEVALQESTGYSTSWLLVVDYQCPSGVTEPTSEVCTVLRSGGAQDLEHADVSLTTNKKLASASVAATLPGEWIVDGEWTDTVFTADLDVTATGPLSSESRRQQWADGTWHRETVQKRAASMSGSVAGIDLDGIEATITRVTTR